MILLDNNILSTFARVHELDLLFRLFPKDKLGVSPTVHDEMMHAIRLGCSFLEPAAQVIRGGRLDIVPLTPAEISAKQGLPSSFGAADAECTIVCRERGDTLLTNDRRVRNFCRTAGIIVFDLPQLLRAL